MLPEETWPKALEILLAGSQGLSNSSDFISV